MKWSELLAAHEKVGEMYPDHIIFTRVNGGYEAFGADAEVVAALCNKGTYTRLDTVASCKLSSRELGTLTQIMIARGHRVAVLEPTTCFVSDGNGDGLRFSEEASF